MSMPARSWLVSIFCLCFALGLAFAQPEPERARPGQAPEVSARGVSGPISVLVGQGGNIGVSAGPDGLLLVDDQFERLVPAIEAALAKLAVPGGTSAPRFLVNTHHHGDHTGANAHFGKAATIVAHENVRARLLDQQAPAPALPVVTYADGLSLHWNGEEVRLIHVAGAHTDGDTVVWFTGSNVVHLGDLYFQVGYPFVDVQSGGNVFGLIEGLSALLPKLPADVRVIPGHGEVGARAELEEYLAMLTTVSERVRAELEKGLDAQGMVDAGVTREFDARWGKFDFIPPVRFVQSVIDSLR